MLHNKVGGIDYINLSLKDWIHESLAYKNDLVKAKAKINDLITDINEVRLKHNIYLIQNCMDTAEHPSWGSHGPKGNVNLMKLDVNFFTL